MKLFGSKRNASRAKKSGFRLTGVQRGILLLLGSVLVLCLTVFAIYKDFVKPMDINGPSSQPTISDDSLLDMEGGNFQPPTVIQIETKVDEGGNEIQVEVEVPAAQKDGFYNILIVGTDDDGTRTDTIMIGRIDVNDHSVALLSIPRDTLINADYTVPKINSVYGRAGGGTKGMEALQKRLANLLGFEVNAYVLVDLDAFIELVDLVGGVEFYVPQDMDYDDPTQDLHIHHKEGLQLLDGQSAMEVVRFRSGYATADIRRTEVQQDFLKALAKKCLEEISLKTIGEMATIFKENVVTDLTLGNIAYFGQELLKCDFEQMFTYTLQGESVMINGADCYALYLEKTLDTINAYFNPYDAEITEKNVNILTPEVVRAAQGEDAQKPNTGNNDNPPADNPPADNPPADNPPADNPPADNPPADNPPADNPPADNPPADNPPVDNPPVDNPPADDPPEDDPPGELVPPTPGEDETIIG